MDRQPRHCGPIAQSRTSLVVRKQRPYSRCSVILGSLAFHSHRFSKPPLTLSQRAATANCASGYIREVVPCAFPAHQNADSCSGSGRRSGWLMCAKFCSRAADPCPAGAQGTPHHRQRHRRGEGTSGLSRLDFRVWALESRGCVMRGELPNAYPSCTQIKM